MYMRRRSQVKVFTSALIAHSTFILTDKTDKIENTVFYVFALGVGGGVFVCFLRLTEICG